MILNDLRPRLLSLPGHVLVEVLCRRPERLSSSLSLPHFKKVLRAKQTPRRLVMLLSHQVTPTKGSFA